MKLEVGSLYGNWSMEFKSMQHVKAFMNKMREAGDDFPNYIIFNDNSDILEKVVNWQWKQRWDKNHCKTHR